MVYFKDDPEGNFPEGYYLATVFHGTERSGIRFKERYEKLGMKRFAGFIED